MNELTNLLANMLNEKLQYIILSDSRNREEAIKVKIRPIMLKGELLFQETLYRGTQVFHHNYASRDMSRRIEELLMRLFCQAQFASSQGSATVLVSKKGKMTVKTKLIQSAREPHNTAKPQNGSAAWQDNEKGVSNSAVSVLAHDKVKQYILKEGCPIDFLVGLGVQTPDGRVTKAKYDKFRQINRYLEFIEDVLEALPENRTIRIIDFGCGKSYLTFAMYYYLHELKQRDIQVTGLDLKADVITHCNQLAKDCGYDKLHFERGDIATYTGADQVDMVVTLHACDTATDFALEKAVKWGAKVIMAVPCCQHEINRQITCEELKPLLRYGLIKERMSALITDAVRANLLEQQGYDTQILEFIDMEHTPKNLLIRAVKRKNTRMNAKSAARNVDVSELMSFLKIRPTLDELLKENAESAKE